MGITALIFDCDGLLVDSETPDFVSWHQVYREHGVTLTRDEWRQYIGGAPDFDPYAELAERSHTAVDRAQIRHRRRSMFQELMRGKELRPGIPDLLAEGRRRGLRLGVASSSSASWVQELIHRYGIEDFFDVVAGRDHVAGRTKPDPAIYRWVLDELDAAAERGLVLEDSRNGLLAAKAAGLACIVIPNEMTAGMDFSEADRVVASAADIDLAAWV